MAKGTKNDLQNITQKTKDRATRTPLKSGDDLKRSRRVNNSCSTCDTRGCCSCYKPGDKSWM